MLISLKYARFHVSYSNGGWFSPKLQVFLTFSPETHNFSHFMQVSQTVDDSVQNYWYLHRKSLDCSFPWNMQYFMQKRPNGRRSHWAVATLSVEWLKSENFLSILPAHVVILCFCIIKFNKSEPQTLFVWVCSKIGFSRITEICYIRVHKSIEWLENSFPSNVWKYLQMVLKLVFRKFHTRLEKFSKFSKFSQNTLFLYILRIEFILEWQTTNVCVRTVPKLLRCKRVSISS